MFGRVAHLAYDGRQRAVLAAQTLLPRPGVLLVIEHLIDGVLDVLQVVDAGVEHVVHHRCRQERQRAVSRGAAAVSGAVRPFKGSTSQLS